MSSTAHEQEMTLWTYTTSPTGRVVCSSYASFVVQAPCGKPTMTAKKKPVYVHDMTMQMVVGPPCADFPWSEDTQMG